MLIKVTNVAKVLLVYYFWILTNPDIVINLFDNEDEEVEAEEILLLMDMKRIGPLPFNSVVVCTNHLMVSSDLLIFYMKYTDIYVSSTLNSYRLNR